MEIFSKVGFTHFKQLKGMEYYHNLHVVLTSQSSQNFKFAWERGAFLDKFN